MLGKDRPLEASAGLLAASCALGAAVSFCAAARVVVAEIPGLPLETAGWLAARLPWFAPLAALAAWMGGHGAAWFARRGWNPAWRAAEGAGVLAVTALLVELAGGYRFPPEAPWWAAIAASLPAFQAAAAWLAAAWLADAAGPAAFAGGAGRGEAPGESSPVAYEGSHTGEVGPHDRLNGETFRGNAAKAWAGVYSRLRRRMLALFLAVAGGWAIASLSVAGNPGAGGAVAVAGGALFAVCGIVFVARVHQTAIALELQGEGAKLLPGIEGGGGRAGAWLLVLPAAVALLLPVNLSPLGLWNFNRWMERFTERVGPLLLPSQAPTRRIGEGLSRISLDRFLVDLASGGRSGDGLSGSLVLLAAAFFAVAFVAWRVFRTPVKGGRPVRMGRLPVGVRWLYEQIRAFVTQWFARWFRWLGVRPVPGSGAAATTTARRRAGRPVRGDYSSVAAIYVEAVERMGRRGLLRRETETPLEYLERYRSRAEAGEGADFGRLTDLYMLERYGEESATAGVLQEARRAAARALRFLSRSKLASAVKSWARQIGAGSRAGE